MYCTSTAVCVFVLCDLLCRLASLPSRVYIIPVITLSLLWNIPRCSSNDFKIYIERGAWKRAFGCVIETLFSVELRGDLCTNVHFTAETETSLLQIAKSLIDTYQSLVSVANY